MSPPIGEKWPRINGDRCLFPSTSASLSGSCQKKNEVHPTLFFAWSTRRTTTCSFLSINRTKNLLIIPLLLHLPMRWEIIKNAFLLLKNSLSRFLAKVKSLFLKLKYWLFSWLINLQRTTFRAWRDSAAEGVVVEEPFIENYISKAFHRNSTQTKSKWMSAKLIS